MEESDKKYPFTKLRYNQYLTLEVMMYVEHYEAMKFMFECNN